MTIDPERTVQLSRVIAAAPETVFRAWTDPEMVLRWHGPRGGRVLGFQRDLVEGGAFTLRMEVAGGKVYHVFGTYREVDFPAARLHVGPARGGGLGRGNLGDGRVSTGGGGDAGRPDS